ncbi:NAD(P)H-binding protein [Acaryochloris sp. IP29b_bin.137]|uniref:NAD(P)-dependent oxidoreductase n=1 Tax=Acaryochloris sp. IP29b_bin.137 TaxID=2969217 RepID=UPI00262797E5|nr:NAD(P)H-binding protein [Acaryochloris sp. IP29b_bin.137]
MRITIFGAAGNVGSRVVAEALSRGHEVTAVVRNPARFTELPTAAIATAASAASVEDVAALSANQDVVISATRPSPGRESELVSTAKTLLAGLRRTGTRLLLVGGAASLNVPEQEGTTVIDDPKFLPAAWRDIGQACIDQLEVCRTETKVDWAYLSPPALLQPGKRTGNYRLGTDDLLIDSQGESTITMEDLAVALLDEAECPHHHRTRFTVAY